MSAPVGEATDPVEALRRLRDAVEFAFYAAEHEVAGGDEEYHSFEVSFDGDGWNEPYSVHAQCLCRGWSAEWSQTDREQTDRPEVADLLLAWVTHYETLTPIGSPCPECEGTGVTVQGWTDKNGYAEDQYGPCGTCAGSPSKSRRVEPSDR